MPTYKTRFHLNIVEGVLVKASDLCKKAKDSGLFPFVFEAYSNNIPRYEIDFVAEGKRNIIIWTRKTHITLSFDIPNTQYISGHLGVVFSENALERSIFEDSIRPENINKPENLANYIKIFNVNEHKTSNKVWQAGEFYIEMANPHINIDFTKYRELAKSMLSQYGEVTSGFLK